MVLGNKHFVLANWPTCVSGFLGNAIMMRIKLTVWPDWAIFDGSWQQTFCFGKLADLCEWFSRQCNHDENKTDSVTRLGYFWWFLATKFLEKVAQIFGNFWGLFWKTLPFKLKYMWLHLGNFCKNWATFYLQHLVAFTAAVSEPNVH